MHVFSHSCLSFFLFTVPAVAAGKVWEARHAALPRRRGRRLPRALDRLARPVLEVADRIVVPSGFLVEVFASPPSHRRGAEHAELDSLPFRQRSPLRPHVIMARHLEPDYNVACGLRAFAGAAAGQSPAATLTIAGDGSEKAMLAALCHELGDQPTA